MHCKKISGVSIPIGLPGLAAGNRSSDERTPRRSEEFHFASLNWINDTRRQPNERRDVAAKVLGNMRTGSKLTLAGLQLTDLPDTVLEPAAESKDISLSGNSLRAVPRAMLNFNKLEHLNISRNALGELPAELKELPKLLSLDVSHNGLAVIPPAIGQLRMLRSLNVGDNALKDKALNKALPETFGNLIKLRKLNLSGNMLVDLPERIRDCVRLEELDISRNHFALLPDEIGELAQLRELNVSNNQLADNPVGQEGNVLLDEKTGNALKAIPESIGTLKHLMNLNVSGNPVKSLPSSFGPFEYASKRRREIKPLEERKLRLSGLRINIDNTPLPEELAGGEGRGGRLPRLTGKHAPSPPRYAPLYSKVSNAPDNLVSPPNPLVQNPIATMAPAIPDLLAAQTHLGTSHVGQLDELLRRLVAGTQAGTTAQMYPVNTGPSGMAVPMQQHTAAEPSFGADVQNGAMHDRVEIETVSDVLSSASSARSFAFSYSPEASGNPVGNRQTGQSEGTASFTQAPTGPTNFASASAPVPGGATNLPMGTTNFVATLANMAAASTNVLAGPANLPAGNANVLGGVAPQASPAMQDKLLADLFQRVAMLGGGSQLPPYIHSAPLTAVNHHRTVFDYSMPAYNDPAHQLQLDTLGAKEIYKSVLVGLANTYKERIYLQGEQLNQRVRDIYRNAQPDLRETYILTQEQMLTREQICARELWTLGVMMFRQHTICGLAAQVVATNQLKREADPSRTDLLLDPLQIALVYETLVSKRDELQILGFDELRSKFDDGPYQRVFSTVVSPENVAMVRQQIMQEVRNAETYEQGRLVAEYVGRQPFWQRFQATQQSAAAAVLRARYGL